MTGLFSSRRQQERTLDMEGFLDILGIFSAEPAGGHPFTLTPLNAACLALWGDGVLEEDSGFMLDVGNMETEGLTSLTIEAENIGLDAAAVSVGHVTSRISARFSRETAHLETGQTTKLQVGILGPGVPGRAVEGEVLVNVRRENLVFEVPIRIKAMSARIGPAPRFHCDDRPCPAEHDFGRVEAWDVTDTNWDQHSALFFRCTMENLGGRSCVLAASIEGEGFELAIAGQVGVVTVEISPGASIDVAVKPTFAPLGPRRALLRLVVERPRAGAVVVSVRLMADIHSSRPLFTFRPRADRVTAVRGHRCFLPIMVVNLGFESDHITVFPVLGGRMLEGKEIDLPPADGAKPAVVEVSVGMETKEIAPGEYTVDLTTGAGVHGQINPAGSVILVVKPPELDFGSIPNSWASSEETGVAYAPAGDMMIPAGAAMDLSVNPGLYDSSPQADTEWIPHLSTIIWNKDLSRESRNNHFKGKLHKMCPLCKAVNEPRDQSCWFCEGSLEGALSVAGYKIARCSLCGGLFSSDYSFCPKDGGNLRPFAGSS